MNTPYCLFLLMFEALVSMVAEGPVKEKKLAPSISIVSSPAASPARSSDWGSIRAAATRKRSAPRSPSPRSPHSPTAPSPRSPPTPKVRPLLDLAVHTNKINNKQH